MRRSLMTSVVAVGLCVLPQSLAAQECSISNVNTGAACAQARDIFSYMAPQLGTSLTGGSHTLGIGTNLGGFPHFAVALRVNAMQGGFPSINDVNVGPFVPGSTLTTEESPIGLPTVDFALGLTKGFNIGVTRIGGIDLIGGVTYVPEIEDGGNSLTAQDGNIAVGLGARIGLLEQSALIPGVSFSYMKRDLPTVDFAFASDQGDRFNINDFSVKTTSWRIAAQKNLLLFQLGAGYGSDSYDFSTVASGVVNPTGVNQSFNFTSAQKMTRTTMYGTLGINLWLFKVVGEVGQVSGGDAPTNHVFETPADASRTYGTVGIRINF